MANKREYDVSDIEVNNDATVHGHIFDVSPVKTSKNRPNLSYFNGKKVARFVSFEPKLRADIEQLKQKKKPVALTRCKIQNNKMDSTSLEILANKFSSAEQSPKKFKVDENSLFQEEDVADKIIPLSDVPKVKVNQVITVLGKILSIGHPQQLKSKDGKPLSKQDCTIADSTGSCRIVLWNENIGRFTTDQTYHLTEVSVRQYAGDVYLSLTANAEVKEADDIGEVIESVTDDADPSTGLAGLKHCDSIAEGEIVSVCNVNEYTACVTCKGKVLPSSTSNLIGQCSKCSTVMKISRCVKAKNAKFTIAATESSKEWNLTAFNEQLEKIIEGAEGNTLQEKLLFAGKTKVTYDTATMTINHVIIH